MSQTRKVATLALLVPILVCAASIRSAHADTIVDTGLNSNGTTSGGWALTGGSFYSSYAGEFSITQSYVLTDVLGWMEANSTSGQLTVAIHSDDAPAVPPFVTSAGEIPGTELYSTTASATTTLAWQGATGLNWALGPGTYWVSFEVRTGDSFDGVMRAYHPVPNPLVNEAYDYWGNGRWVEGDNLNLGVRDLGTPSGGTAVPLPPAAFAGLGLLATLGLARRLRRRKA